MSLSASAKAGILLTLLSIICHKTDGQVSNNREDSALQSKLYAWGGVDSNFISDLRSTVFFPFGKPDSNLLRATSHRIKDAMTLQINMPKNSQRLNIKRPVRVVDGSISYQMQYRSAIDTPLLERDVFQNMVTAQVNLIVGDIAPVGITYLGRRSNSVLLRNLNDVQVSFDRLSFQRILQSGIIRELEALSRKLTDSLDNESLTYLKGKLQGYQNWLGGTAQLQKLIEVNEIMNVPRITYDPNLSEPENQRRERLYKQSASYFKKIYEEVQSSTSFLKAKADSLDSRIRKVKEAISDIDQVIQQAKTGKLPYDMLMKTARKAGTAYGDSVTSAKYRWLLGLRRASLGRSSLNYSELTGKNLAVNGLNLEYGDKFYVAAVIGRVDFRFRDFVINSSVKRLPQPLFLGKVGVGRPEQSHIYITGFKGTKQLINGSPARRSLDAIKIAGTGIEVKWAFHTRHFIEGEIMQTYSQDIRSNPMTGTSEKEKLSDKNRRGYSVHFVSSFPAIQSRWEGSYRYTGSDFQSFNNYQTSVTRESWMLKWDQTFFKRKLRLALSVRKNEFSNPYLVQRYNSQAIFKSATISFHQRRWPTVTFGYLPVSQVLVLDSQLVETRFQSLYGTIIHQYKVGSSKASSSLVFNKFYNNRSDSGYAYYNATSLLLSQSFYFTDFSTITSFSYTANQTYNLSVIDENFIWNLKNSNTLGFGIKVNNYNRQLVRVGGYLQSSLQLFKDGRLVVQYEKGFLPGYRGDLIAASFGSIQFTKYLRFQKG